MDSLIKRLQDAESGARELDAEICVLLQYGGENSSDAQNVRVDPEDEQDGWLIFEIGAEECCNPVPKLTRSLDAIVALIGEKIPGAHWRTHWIDFRDPVMPPAWAAAGPPGAGEQAWAQTPPLALCIALLLALQSQEPTP